MSGSRRALRSVLPIVGLAAVAVLLRVIGLSFGLPAVYNPDEVAIMNRTLSLGQTGLNPHNFLYPTFYFYVLLAWEGLWFVIGRATHVYASLHAFETAFFVDPSAIYLAGRLLSVFCGTLTVVATWKLGTQLFGRIAGIAAALLLAVAPLAVRDAHYVKHDVPVTLLVVLTHVVLATWLIEPSRGGPSTMRRWLLTGALAGLAMSTHYYAVFLAVPLTVGALLPDVSGGPGKPLRVRLRRLAIVGVACAVAFFATSPFLLVEPGTVIRDIVANREIVMDRTTDARGLFGALGFYLSWLTRDAAGSITFALATAGIVAVSRAGMRRATVALAFPVVFLLFIGNTFPASRYLNPMLPFVAVLAGACCAWLSSMSGPWRSLATVLLTAAAVEGTLASTRADVFFRQTDTRTLAQSWIAEHIPSGASILVQPYSVPLRPSREGLVEALAAHLGSADLASVKFQRQLALDPYPTPAYRTLYLGVGGLDQDKIYIDPARFTDRDGLAPLRALSVTHVVLKRYNAANSSDSSIAALTAALEREGHRLAAFSPYRHNVDVARLASVVPFLHNTDARIDDVLERPGRRDRSLDTQLMQLYSRLREAAAQRVRAVPLVTSLIAKHRRRKYEQRIEGFLTRKDGHAGRLPAGVVYEATMRCNLHCEFCYVGTLLNLEGEWREELSIDVLRRAFPEQDGLQVSLTGGEIFMRKDILDVMEVFRGKGYTCGYLTTNGTIISDERADALAQLASRGFLKHISVSIDGPGQLHDKARGVAGTFERTAAGLRRLQASARTHHAPLRVSVNTTVAHETLDALHEMVDVAAELGVDAIGLNHLMYSTPAEVTETARLLGDVDPAVISTFVTPDPGLDPARVRQQVATLAQRCRERGIRFDMRPKVKDAIIEPYYTPGSRLEGRCLYPFLYARVSFSGKAYFCPFIRLEVGDLTQQSLEEVWTGERYVSLRKRLVENGIFPVCRRCCKVELAQTPAGSGVGELAGSSADEPAEEPLAVAAQEH